MAAPNQPNNQLSDKELKKLIELLQKIDKLTETTARNQADQAQQAGNARQQLERLEDTWNDITGDISYAATGFQKALEEIKNSNEGLNQSKKAYSALTSLVQQLNSYQKGTSELSEKELTKIKEKYNSEKQRLGTANELLISKQTELETSKVSTKSELDSLAQIIGNLQQQKESRAGISEAQEQTLKKSIEQQTQLEKKYSSIGKQIDINNEALQQNTAIIAEIDANAEGLKFTLEEITKKVKFENIDNLDKSFKDIINETQTTDDSIKKINKSFNSLASIAQQIQDHQSGTNKLSEKEACELFS